MGEIKLFPDWTMGIQLAIFLMVMLVLSKGLFKPVLAVLDERRRRSTGMQEAASALEAELADKVAHCERVMDDARTRALAERERLRSEGSAEAKARIHTAREKSDQALAALRVALQAEALSAKASMDALVSQLSGDVVKKVLMSVVLMFVSASAWASAGAAQEGLPRALGDHAINFVLLVGLLIFLLKKPLRAFFSERHNQISQSVNAAETKRKAIEARAAEVNARLARLEADAAALQTSIVSGAERERTLMIEEADALSKKIIEDVSILSSQELKKAKEALKVHALALTFERAESELKTALGSGATRVSFDRARTSDLRGRL